MLCMICDSISDLHRGDTYRLSCEWCCQHESFDTWLLTCQFAGYREGFASYACKGCGTVVSEEQLLG